ncbi:hypothetical protein L6164_021756 [Bauhinia variegata]|uniref:Uncharacterized protein n=1 Tax=Bauhinia variegata TaxID=167791 RepID=A0ACB9MDD8_BAUVA|nr:hypothetical protein L6164_021756 [Bauhinia variegata]
MLYPTSYSSSSLLFLCRSDSHTLVGVELITLPPASFLHVNILNTSSIVIWVGNFNDFALSCQIVIEALDVARNSIELLSTVLSSSPQQDVLKDDLTTTLVQQSRQSQSTVQRIIESAGDNEALLFEALNVNDEIQKVLRKYDELKKSRVNPDEPESYMIPVAVGQTKEEEYGLIRKPVGSRGGSNSNSNDDMLDDLDEMIFGKRGGGTSDEAKKQQSSKDK